MKNRGFHIICTIILAALAYYIANNEIRARHNAQKEVKRHANVIAESLWDFDSKAPKAYIELAVRNNFYEKFTIRTETGRVLISTTGHPIETLSDRVFASLKLIPSHFLSCDVMYKGHVIGQIEIIARIKTIYSDLYAVILGLLSLFAVKFFFTILKTNRELDKRVHQRTIELENEIRERQKVEETLRESEEKLITEKAFTENIINSMPGIFYAFNESQHLIKWNKNLEDLLGECAEKILQNEFNLLGSVPGEKEKGLLAERQHFRRTGETLTVEAHFIAKDKSKVPMFCTASFITIGGENYFIGVGIDTSEKKKLEAKLRQAQKMEAIGTLAGGIAHDFNNILTAILGYAELAQDDIEDVESQRKNLAEVYQGALRASALVKQILTFSRKKDLELHPLKIQLVIKEALKLLRSSIPTTIEIKQDISECESVLADPTQIHQVIMNLCTNAYHAMRETGGVLGVSLKPVEVTSSFADNKINLSTGNYVKLEVSDTGTGIAKNVQDRIFDPYYTTKPTGEGTGLGLAVVHGIVADLNGEITLYSELNYGTTFRIYLPIIASEADVLQNEGTVTLPTGDEKILIVDDEPAIVELAAKILSNLGYKITAVTSSVEALQKFQESPGYFDLLITDMTMPHMTGAELSKNILKVQPDIKIIMCTGFSDLINENRAKAIGIYNYIMKPFTKKGLAEVIRNALDHS